MFSPPFLIFATRAGSEVAVIARSAFATPAKSHAGADCAIQYCLQLITILDCHASHKAEA